MSDTTEKGSAQNRFWEEMGVPLVTVQQARLAVKMAFDAGLVPALVGHAGIGKTQSLKEEGREDRGGGYYGWYLQTAMPEDVQGLAFRAPNGKSYDYLQQSQIVNNVDSHEGGVIVLEELNRASKETAAAAFAFMDQFHENFPKGWHLALAMNPSGGEYATDSLIHDPALRRRVVWIAVREDRTEWLRYARDRELHPMVIAYIEANANMLLDTKRRAAGRIYATPASWEKVSTILKTIEEQNGGNLSPIPAATENVLSGLIGDTAAGEVLRFIEDNNIIIHPQEVLESYKGEKSEVRSRVRNAIRSGRVDVVSALCDNLKTVLLSSMPKVNKKLCENLVTFLKDLPNELRMVVITGFREANTQEASRWVSTLQLELVRTPGYSDVFTSILGDVTKVEEALSDEEANKK